MAGVGIRDCVRVCICVYISVCLQHRGAALDDGLMRPILHLEGSGVFISASMYPKLRLVCMPTPFQSDGVGSVHVDASAANVEAGMDFRAGRSR